MEWREVELTYPADAVVEAVAQATVAAQLQGRVVDVRVDAGQSVRKGELLMRIDDREASQAVAASDAQIAQARATLANTKAELDRTRRLLAQKFVSQAAVDQAEAAHRVAEAQLEIALAGRGQTGTIRSFATVTSPIAGVVAQRHTELGEMAASGKPLVTVFDPSGLRAVASVPQHRLAEVRRGASAKVEFPETGRWVDATRVELLPIADARSHVARARIYLPPAVGGVLPGMFARVHFVIGRVSRLIAPASAILRRGELTAAYVIDAKGVAGLRQVRLGEYAAEGMVEVLAGVSEGEQVALDPVKAGIVHRQPRTVAR